MGRYQVFLGEREKMLRFYKLNRLNTGRHVIDCTSRNFIIVIFRARSITLLNEIKAKVRSPKRSFTRCHRPHQLGLPRVEPYSKQCRYQPHHFSTQAMSNTVIKTGEVSKTLKDGRSKMGKYYKILMALLFQKATL